jgi:L,D-transpeptidase ErfK/SrfK
MANFAEIPDFKRFEGGPQGSPSSEKGDFRSGRGPCELALILLLLFLPSLIFPNSYPWRPGKCPSPPTQTVIGVWRQYEVKREDTLLDIARRFDLGFNELQILYPEVDPWVPPEGMILRIPTIWVLPEFEGEGIVINVPEFRLYLFLPKLGLVKTHPVGIGIRENPTPIGLFKIREKKVDPIWYIPPSLKGEYKGIKYIPPGPDNPLGKYWIGLSLPSYGIHGTNKPWGVGRLVSRGCIRLYPEDIETLFPLVKIGMPVKFAYELVKFGCKDGRIFVEVHPDIYNRIPDLKGHALSLAEKKGLLHKISLPLLFKAVEERKGVPIDVTKD